MAQRTKAQLKQQSNTTYNTNGQKSITAESVRDFNNDLLDSVFLRLESIDRIDGEDILEVVDAQPIDSFKVYAGWSVVNAPHEGGFIFIVYVFEDNPYAIIEARSIMASANETPNEIWYRQFNWGNWRRLAFADEIPNSNMVSIEKTDLIFQQQELLTYDKFLIEIGANSTIVLDGTPVVGKHYTIVIKNISNGEITITRPNTGADTTNPNTFTIADGKEVEVSMWFDGTKRRWLYSPEM